jgi:hypothetical protein
MDLAKVANLARSLSDAEFAERFPGLYLVCVVMAESSSIPFQTQIAHPDQKVKTTSTGHHIVTEVLRVAKAEGNPYPDRIAVGRARNCDVVMRHPSVSKLHAHFRTTGKAFAVVDLNSQNGTRVNGQGLGAHQAEPVGAGDLIEFGSAAARLVDAPRLQELLRY